MGADTFWGLSATAWTGIYTLLTGGLLVVAVVAALYAKGQWDSARDQAEETRQAQREASRPYVIVTVEPSRASQHLFDLVLRNIGRRPAETVSITLDPPPISAQETKGHKLSDAKMLNEPVAIIAPGQEMRAFYDSHLDRHGREDLPTVHTVSLSYRDSSGYQYTGTSVIDINAMKGTMFTDVKTIHDIGQSLAEIQETLRNASVMDRRGGLDVQASVERRDEQQERLAKQRAELHERHERTVHRLLPNGTDTDQTGETG